MFIHVALSCSYQFGLMQQSAGILTQSNANNLGTPKHGPSPESQKLNTSAKSLSKDIISSRSKPTELVVEKSSPCINADYEYVNM